MMNEGIRLLKQGQYDRALQHLLDIHGDTPENPELSYYLGLCYTHMDKYDEALLYLEQVVSSELSFTHVYQSRMILGYIYAVTGRHRLAEFEFRGLLDDESKALSLQRRDGFRHAADLLALVDGRPFAVAPDLHFILLNAIEPGFVDLNGRDRCLFAKVDFKPTGP